MKIPKYIDELINKRIKYAEKLSGVSSELDDWLMKNNIPCGSDYTLTGCMIYFEPVIAAELVRQDILNFDKGDNNDGRKSNDL